ncbi:hypothetical protein B0T10DRAFT_287825 [Thelonectria olida]|uniref:DUF6594 domain-containing protein n=1 Tax=Thelonectria olida TaxID=1576542 RepID=A0A9P8W701_9HYPO|nr:hypothetical protein B0T10DRAFT_287825 [Thelonectria olida]
MDIEMGKRGGACLPVFNNSTSSSSRSTLKKEDKKERSTRTIEEYKAGYPQFSALISSDDRFFVSRRFNRLRARLLLLKQDKLSMLEKRLDEIDDLEKSPLFLGKSRIDRNPDRIAVLSEIEASLEDYDQFVERTHKSLGYDKASRREATSLQNWLGNNRSLAREETAYLSHSNELFAVSLTKDSAMLRFESWVEDNLIRLSRRWRSSNFHVVSTDMDVFIYSGPWIKRIAKGLMLFLTTLLLLMPIVICNVVKSTTSRIVVVMISTISYLLVLSGLTQSKTIELIVAGTT